jgi:hypothetical protein
MPAAPVKTRITEMLGIEKPIIQAAMGWIARSQLSSAVSNAGGMGIIETSSGQLDAIREEIKKMKTLTDKPFGVNVAQAFVRDPNIISFIIDQGIKFVTTSAGDPMKYTSTLKDAGLTVFHVVPSLAGAMRAIEAGVDGLIELARLFKAGAVPDRSVVFAAWTAEEAGLLGAEYYAANPVWPLETTVANINMDSFLPGAEISPQIVVMGAGKRETDRWLERRATEQGRVLIPDPAPQAGGFYRSDHFPLAKMGVPALFGAAGFTGHNAASRDYVANRYHKPSDEWTSDWVMDAAAVDVDLLYRVGRDLADSRAWPEWNAGAEFEAARAASAAARE